VPRNSDTSADVSGVSAVNDLQDTKHVTQGLHRSRAAEVLLGNAIGTAVAISSVFIARSAAPQLMRQCESWAAQHILPSGTTAGGARKTLNTALMLTSGLCSGIASQTVFARKRRDQYGLADDISMQRDITRLLTGWSFGSFGASAAYYLAETHIPQALRGGEKLLDGLLNGFEYAPSNRLSEALAANAAMTVGAIPANVVGQRVYDTVFKHPVYSKEH
jgi:hypothetical protein